MPRPIGYRAKKPTPAKVLAAQDAQHDAAQAAAEKAFDATDSARKLAVEHNINLADITGTGVDGRITKGDVELAITAAGAAQMETTGGEQ